MIFLCVIKHARRQYTCVHTLGVPPVVCGHEGQLFINDLMIEDREVAAYSNDDKSVAGITDLNRKRKRQSAELQAGLNQLSVLRKQND